MYKQAISTSLPKNIWDRSSNLLYKTVNRALSNPRALDPMSNLDSRLRRLANRVASRGYGADNSRLVKHINDGATQATTMRMHSPTGHAAYRQLGEAMSSGGFERRMQKHMAGVRGAARKG